MNPLRIPFNRPTTVPQSLDYIMECAATSRISGDGPFTLKCQKILSEMLSGRRVALTTSGTHALEFAALLLDLSPGDEVIIPSFTFSSTANAFVLRGARPVWIDVRPDTLNLDERLLPDLITARTKAIVPVHYAGVACEMDQITRIAHSHGIAIVEDNAHGLCGTYRGQPLGNFGVLAALSFHETKNFSCGEGGALIINDSAYEERAEIIREKGTDRSRFWRGEIDKYTWQDVGSSFLPADLLAAYLLGQLEQREWVQEQRLRIWNRYATSLAHWAEANGISLPTVPHGVEHPAHLFYLLLPSEPARRALVRHLRDRGILAVTHYVPLHSSPFGRRLGGQPDDCPVTESVSERLLRLPLFTNMSPEELDDVVDAVTSFEAAES